jgi:hypothetical protein
MIIERIISTDFQQGDVRSFCLGYCSIAFDFQVKLHMIFRIFSFGHKKTCGVDHRYKLRPSFDFPVTALLSPPDYWLKRYEFTAFQLVILLFQPGRTGGRV